MSRAFPVAMAVAALVLAAGCGGDDDESSPAGTAAETQIQTQQTAEESGGERFRAALNQIVAECTRRRGERGRVGNVSREFQRSVETLIEELQESPERRIQLRSGEAPTTVSAILRRVSTSLRQEVPDGCGGNTRRSRTEELADEIRQALREAS